MHPHRNPIALLSQLAGERDALHHPYAALSTTVVTPSGSMNGATALERRVLELYDEGRSMRHIERATGVGRMSVPPLVARFGRQPRGRLVRARRQQVRQAILAAARSGLGVVEIARQVGISGTAIRMHLSRAQDDRVTKCQTEGHWVPAGGVVCRACEMKAEAASQRFGHRGRAERSAKGA